MASKVYDSKDSMSHRFHGSGTKALNEVFLTSVEYGNNALLKLDTSSAHKKIKERFKDKIEFEKIESRVFKLDKDGLKQLQEEFRNLDKELINGLYSVAVFYDEKRIFQSLIHKREVKTDLDADWKNGEKFISQANEVIRNLEGHILPKEPLMTWWTKGKSYDIRGTEISTKGDEFNFIGYKPVLDAERKLIKFEETKLKRKAPKKVKIIIQTLIWPFLLQNKVKTKYRKIRGKEAEQSIADGLYFEDIENAVEAVEKIKEVNRKYYPNLDYEETIGKK